MVLPWNIPVSPGVRVKPLFRRELHRFDFMNHLLSQIRHVFLLKIEMSISSAQAFNEL